MKKIIAALVVSFSHSAFATELVAYWALPSGYVISLHTAQRVCKDGRHDLLVMTPKGSVLAGCWKIGVKDGEKTLLIQVEGADEVPLNLNRFTMVD